MSALNGNELPALNAFLNFSSTVLLISAYIAVRRGKIHLHKRLMLTAIGTSTAFLTSYLIHKMVVKLHTPYAGPSEYKTLYLWLLGTHTILAMAILPLVFLTTWRALRVQNGDLQSVSSDLQLKFEKHRKIARWTFPIWLYVSITGVIIYFVLYQLPKYYSAS